MCSEEYFKNVMKESFSDIEEEVMSAYGKNYIEKAKEIYKNVMINHSSNVKLVYDAIEAAVTLQNPCDIYRPVRNIYIKCLLMLGERIPFVLHEVAVKMALSISGLPSPKKGLNIISGLFNM